MPDLHIGQWANGTVDWMQGHLAGLFALVAWVLGGVEAPIAVVLASGPVWLWVAFFVLVGFVTRGWLGGLLTLVGALLILDMGLWNLTMATLAMVLASGIFSLLIGIAFGILSAEFPWISSPVRTILDFMQTMPAYVYLIPAVIFFGLGVVPAILATFVFAAPPAVRLTELGLRQVPNELLELAESFGATRWQTLVKVKLPLALPSLLAGVNQTIMLALSMVVIAGMIGGGGLGDQVLTGIQTLNVGEGFTAGLAVVLLAIYLDRVTGALGQNRIWLTQVLRSLHAVRRTGDWTWSERRELTRRKGRLT